MAQAARHHISEMTEISERSLAETFGWKAAEERLYRDCPSAFWLAPDGDPALPPTHGPSLEPAAPVLKTPPTPDDYSTGNTRVEGAATGMALALIAAGPAFFALAILTLDTGAGLLQRLAMAAMSFIALPFTVVVGIILSTLPIAAGTALLSRLGLYRPAARLRRVWAATGAGMGLAIAGLFDAQFVTVPLVLTSVACAALVRKMVSWVDAEPA